MISKFKPAAVLVLGVVIGAGAGTFGPKLLNHGAVPNQPYADQQGRTISSLSAKDVEQLQRGEGWGLAKPAEFNGYPGPSHVIELAEKLALDEAQKVAVQDSFSRMRAQAVVLGEALVRAERALDEAFVQKTVTTETLNRLLAESGRVRAQLRAVHLSAHLEVTPLLTDEQKVKYASLRGYGSGHQGH